MNLVTLINNSKVTIASGRLLYGADETAALESAVQAAQALIEAEQSASARINAAIEEGRKQGFEQGYAAGKQQGQNETSAELARLTQQAQACIEQQRNSSSKMALQIVRKIAGQFAPEQTLAALAQVAASELGSDESITLRVHPLHSSRVKQQLLSLTGHDKPLANLSSVVADASLNESDCVMETRHGSVIADLDTQLRSIEQSLEAADG